MDHVCFLVSPVSHWSLWSVNMNVCFTCRNIQIQPPCCFCTVISHVCHWKLLSIKNTNVSTCHHVFYQHSVWLYALIITHTHTHTHTLSLSHTHTVSFTFISPKNFSEIKTEWLLIYSTDTLIKISNKYESSIFEVYCSLSYIWSSCLKHDSADSLSSNICRSSNTS